MSEREVLPIPDRPYDGPVYEDAKDPDAILSCLCSKAPDALNVTLYVVVVAACARPLMTAPNTTAQNHVLISCIPRFS